MKKIIIILAIIIIGIIGFIFLGLKTDDYFYVNIFLGNQDKNPQTQDCKIVFPVERKIKKTDEIIRTTLEELLTGPTDAEKNKKYFTGINEGVIINSIILRDKTIIVDFNEKLEEGIGGSCMVAFIRSQINETLKQFTEITEVVISINGRTEDILQP